MRLPALLALLLCVVCFVLCSEGPMWGYRFVDKNLTWSEAQQFCRQHYHDLACVSSSEDNGRLPRPPGYSAPVWIGLYDDLTRSQWKWKWSATGSDVSFDNWERFGQPQTDQQCVYLYPSGYHGHRCSDKCFPLCSSGSNPKVLNLVTVAMTWFDALATCRANNTDLVVIESTQEYSAAMAMSADLPHWSWSGIYTSTEKWSDNRSVTFLPWHGLFVRSNYTEPFCAAENELNSWEAYSCQEKRPFYCQEEPKSRRFVKVKFSGREGAVVKGEVLEEMQKMFEAAGRTDVKLTWKTAPKKQEEKKEEAKPDDCPDL